ncbi:MAG: EMC3/TMCO1 family protein [Candidatus Heimdallarchaeota archaeon]
MFQQITGMMITAFDVVFSPLQVFSPHISLLIVSAILTLIVLCVNKFSVNREVAEQIKNRMREIRESLTKAQKAGDTEEINKFLGEMMKINNQYMRIMLKSMVVSIIILAMFLPWLKYRYGGMAVVNLPFSMPVIGSSLNWILWYVLVSFTIGWVAKKLLGMDYA